MVADDSIWVAKTSSWGVPEKFACGSFCGTGGNSREATWEMFFSEETNGTFVGGHKFLTSRSSVVQTNCVHICQSVRSLFSRHFCATSTFWLTVGSSVQHRPEV